MAVIESGASTDLLTIEANSKAARVIPIARGSAYCVSNITGTIAAALAANSSVFAMRLDPGSTVNAFIERVRIHYTTIVAYTTPVTASRRLALFRGSGAATSGGTAITAAVKKNTSYGASQFDTAEGGDLRIASTGALTVTGITYESDPIRTVSLVHCGAAGAFMEQIWEFSATESAPIQLNPGQLIAIRNPAAMDAAGTWQLAVSVDWHEAAAIT